MLKLKILNGNFLGEMNCNFVVKIVIASTEQVSKYTVFEADQFFYGCQSFFFFFFFRFMVYITRDMKWSEVTESSELYT